MVDWDLGFGTHISGSVMTLAGELMLLLRKLMEKDKKIRKLEGENVFLAEVSVFSLSAVGGE